MKRQIRYGVFETNSSSSHSLVVTREINKDGFVGRVIGMGYYGWGYEEMDDPISILEYINTEIKYDTCREEILDKFKEWILGYTGEEIEFVYEDDSYIDHQSCGTANVKKMLEDKDYFLNIVFGGTLTIDNDNRTRYSHIF